MISVAESGPEKVLARSIVVGAAKAHANARARPRPWTPTITGEAGARRMDAPSPPNVCCDPQMVQKEPPRVISFLKDNPLKINPLSNKSLSEELGLHPSTISRILRSKYIDTPKGIMPLKSLLVSSVSKTRDVTPIQLMQLIESIIKNEKKPKSDNKIALELNKRGFNLARRTITKYRKRLNIASSRNR